MESFRITSAGPRVRPLSGTVYVGGAKNSALKLMAAALLAPAIAAVDLPVVVAVVGTDGDPQGRSRQVDALVAAGAEVHLSNAGATRRALELVEASR